MKYIQHTLGTLLLIIMVFIFVIIIFNRIIKIQIKKKEAADFKAIAEHDQLTGIYNRETFYLKARKLLEQNSDKQYVIACLNIERFKVINDLFGVEEGDKLLKYIATNILRFVDNKNSICGRIGGDIFVVCFPYKSGFEQRIIKNSTNLFEIYPLDINISFRFGVYFVEDYKVPVNIMCDRANLASESIKGNCLDHISFYNDEHRQRLIKEQEIINDMNEALKQEQFKIYYQPIYDVQNGNIVSAEALVRWQHPTKGIISPEFFLPLFEQNGFISKLDSFVRESVCKLLAKRKEQGRRNVPVSVNFSRIEFYIPNLCEDILEMTKKYNIETGFLRCEITESAYTDNPNQLMSAVNKLRGYGFTILMDDFGSGYSSLNLLKDIPVDILKVDMKFIDTVETSNKAASIMNCIIQMAKSIDIKVIAEGAENDAQISFLRNIGCEYVQGYYYSKPLCEEDFEKSINNF